MKFKLIVFSCLFIIKRDVFVTTNSFSLDIKEPIAEQYPFIAHLETSCLGFSAVLITRLHLITPADCDDWETKVAVYFDIESSTIPMGKHIQEHTASRIMTYKHEHSRIALLELEQPVTFSDTIRPAKLVSEEAHDLFEKDANVQVIGWYRRYANSNYLIRSMATYKIQDKPTCNNVLGRDRLCAMPSDDTFLAQFSGNVMTFQNKVAGFLIDRIRKSSAPYYTDIFLSVAPFVNWISEKVGVPVEELTGIDETTRGALKKIKDLTQKLQDCEAKYQQSTTNADGKINEILSKFESYKKAQINYLVEQLDSVYNEVDKINQKFENIENKLKLDLDQRTELEFQTNNSIQELGKQNDAINGLQAKISKIETECISKTEENFKRLLNDMEEKENRQFEKIENKLKLDLNQRTELEVQTYNSIQELGKQNNAINGLQAKITKIETECISKTEENFKKLLNDMEEKENGRFNKLEKQVNNLTDNFETMIVQISEIWNFIDKPPPRQ